jgi:hypothetical protein
VDARASSALSRWRDVRMAGDHHHSPNYHLAD